MSDHTPPLRLIPRNAAVQAELNSNVIETLEEALAEARAGAITSIVLIAAHPTLGWSHEQSGVTDFSAAIGRLEILKQEWISRYITLMQECPQDAS
jgi:hypothetical protein